MFYATHTSFKNSFTEADGKLLRYDAPTNAFFTVFTDSSAGPGDYKNFNALSRDAVNGYWYWLDVTDNLTSGNPQPLYRWDGVNTPSVVGNVDWSIDPAYDPKFVKSGAFRNGLIYADVKKGSDIILVTIDPNTLAITETGIVLPLGNNVDLSHDSAGELWYKVDNNYRLIDLVTGITPLVFTTSTDPLRPPHGPAMAFVVENIVGTDYAVALNQYVDSGVRKAYLTRTNMVTFSVNHGPDIANVPQVLGNDDVFLTDMALS